MTFAPLQESPQTAALSVTHAPLGKGGKNWITRTGPGNSGQLPAYIQNVRNGIMKSGKTESEATGLAIGVVRNWASGKGKVSPEVRAAAAKAVAQFETLRAKSKASDGKVSEALMPTLERVIGDAALSSLALVESRIGEAGIVALLEADGGAWSPTTKRIASASGEKERHQVMDGTQIVGTISSRQGYKPMNGQQEPDRWRASAVNGTRVGDYEHPSKGQALSSLKRHLEEASARVQPFTDGQYLVAKPSTYGQDSYVAYPNEPTARYNAGLPAMPSTPEQNSQVDALGESVALDLVTLSSYRLPVLRRVQEARRARDFRLTGQIVEGFAGDFNPGELRNFRGRWEAGGRKRLEKAFTSTEEGAMKTPQPDHDLEKVYDRSEKHLPTFAKILTNVGARMNAEVHDDSQTKRDAPKIDVSRAHVMVAPLKGKDRAAQKVAGKYRGDASQLRDVVRGSVLVPHANDLPDAIEAVRKELPAGWTLTAPESRYTNIPGSHVHKGYDSSGYHDVAVLLRAPDGYQAELQINTTHMADYKNGEGHALYEKVRVIVEGAHGDHRDLTRTELRTTSRLNRQMRDGYDAVYKRSTR